MLPEINKTYNCFDDGKVTNGRLYTVDITEIIPFSEIDSETLNIWKQKVKQSYWLYATETDYFIKFTNGEEGKDGMFVRTKTNGWFGMGDYWNSGRLDIDNSLTDSLK